LDDKLLDLQTRISFQEAEIESLNTIVSEQRQEIEALQRQMTEVLDLLRELRPGLSSDGDDQPPPHY